MDEIDGAGLNWKEVATTAAIALVVAGAVWYFTTGRYRSTSKGEA